AYATYTTNDGATLASATVTGGGISVSVESIANNLVTINVICPAFSDGYPVTVDGTDSLGRPVTTNFTVNVFTLGPVFTVNDTTCQQGQLATVTANLSGSDVGSVTIFTITNGVVATQLNVPVISFGDVTIPISCDTVGSTTFNIEVEDLDTQLFSGSGTITVTPAVPSGILNVNNSSCLEGSSTLVTATYSNAVFPAYQINSVSSVTSDLPATADDVGVSITPPTNSFDVMINCFTAGTATISIIAIDTNGDAYGVDATITVDPPASPPYFSGGTNHVCTVGQQYVMNFEYIENEPGTPTLASASVNMSGAVSVQPGNITLINGNMWVSVLVDCDFVGLGTVDVFATTTSGTYPNVDVTGITFTVNPP
ncbi:MAG TPA: hypothetical protein PLZ51_23410, partial [Aggregatilineales bacterium]|nr:hypothetical protein [Aggregatilineales bacterium]